MNKQQAYAPLSKILTQAYDQASGGKGADRHTTKAAHPFIEQPILASQRLFGRGFAFGQVTKKMEESQRLSYGQARTELLGAIVYLSAAIIHLDEENSVDLEEAEISETQGTNGLSAEGAQLVNKIGQLEILSANKMLTEEGEVTLQNLREEAKMRGIRS